MSGKTCVLKSEVKSKKSQGEWIVNGEFSQLFSFNQIRAKQKVKRAKEIPSDHC